MASRKRQSPSYCDTSKPLRRYLLDVLQREVIPAFPNSDSWQVFLAEPPFRLPNEVTVSYHAGMPLTMQQAANNPSYSVVHFWPSVNVHSSRSPYMGFVLQGEIDWRIGITSETAKRMKDKFTQSDYALLAIPERTFFLMPPGVPYSSGQLNHWERELSENPDFRVFWIRFIPQGVMCHIGSARPIKEMIFEAYHFIPDPHLLFMANALIDELRQQGQAAVHTTSALLQFIFYRISHALGNLKELRPGYTSQDETNEHASHQAVASARDYIASHLHEKLSVDDIAKHSLVSSGHLSRIFREETGLTMNQYITHYRLERACSLLRDSSLSVSLVGQSVGYPDSTYFGRLFARHYGCLPLRFRQNHLRDHQE